MIDDLTPLMQRYLDGIDASLLKEFNIKPTSEWEVKENSPVATIEFSMTAIGKDSDPYELPLSDEEEERTEKRYDRQYSGGYDVRWSPVRGTFYLYQFGEYVQCYPTNY